MATILSCGQAQVTSDKEPIEKQLHFFNYIEPDSSIYCDTRFGLCFKVPKGYEVEDYFLDVTDEQYRKFGQGSVLIELIKCTNIDSGIQIGLNAVDFNKNLQEMTEAKMISNNWNEFSAWSMYSMSESTYMDGLRSKASKFSKSRNFIIRKSELDGVESAMSMFNYTVNYPDLESEIDFTYIQNQVLFSTYIITYYMHVPTVFWEANPNQYLDRYYSSIKKLNIRQSISGGEVYQSHHNEWFQKIVDKD